MDVMAPRAKRGQATLACLKFLAQRLLTVPAGLRARPDSGPSRKSLGEQRRPS